MLCSIEGCSRPAIARGMCKMHWARWRKYGTPAVPLPVPNERLLYLNDVVLAYDGVECLSWPYERDAQGYARLGETLVHNIVCEKRHGPRPTPTHETAHGCGKGSSGCVAQRHLRWATRKENHADKVAHGTHNRGERHPMHKITEDDARQILAMKGTMSQQAIADKIGGVSRHTVSLIHLRKRWAWLT